MDAPVADQPRGDDHRRQPPGREAASTFARSGGYPAARTSNDAYAVQERQNEILVANAGMGRPSRLQDRLHHAGDAGIYEHPRALVGEVFEPMVFHNTRVCPRRTSQSRRGSRDRRHPRRRSADRECALHPRQRARCHRRGDDLHRTGGCALPRLSRTRHPDHGRGQFLQCRVLLGDPVTDWQDFDLAGAAATCSSTAANLALAKVA